LGRVVTGGEQTSLENGYIHPPTSTTKLTLSTSLRNEKDIELIGGSPGFVDIGSLAKEVLTTMLPMHEEWSGTKLNPVIAYGLRIYTNNTNLLMHTDKVSDHVISSIVHVGHDPDSEPWPLVIEGFDGRTSEVILEEGEMLFYESAKCLHGRPTHFNGEWYTSIFVHYKPVGKQAASEASRERSELVTTSAWWCRWLASLTARLARLPCDRRVPIDYKLLLTRFYSRASLKMRTISLHFVRRRLGHYAF